MNGNMLEFCALELIFSTCDFCVYVQLLYPLLQVCLCGVWLCW